MMIKERTPKTPASGRSIVRNHSPYCESTGPIVQEGFVAARIRALQGFSNQAQIVTRSHSPVTPCPSRWLHVYKSRSLPKPFLALKPVLTGTDMLATGTIKRCHTEILSKDHQKFASASVGSTRSSDIAPISQLKDQQSTLESSAQTRLYDRARVAQNPSPNLFADTAPSQYVQRNQDHITAATPSTPYVSRSEVDQVDDMPVENSPPPEKTILSSHAIQPDLVEPWSTWNCLPQAEDHDNYNSHEQALKSRGSIAEKLGSIVERGWVGGDAFGNTYGDESASHTRESIFHVRDATFDSGSNFLSEMARPTKMPSYNRALSVSIAEARSESQRSSGQDTPPHAKQKEPRKFVYPVSQKQMQGHAERNPAVKRTQRSSSGSGVQRLKTEFAPHTKNRRAWTLHHLDRSTSNHSQIQREASPPILPSYTRGHCISELDHESRKPPLSREGSTSQSGFDPSMLRDKQPRQDSAVILKITGSRRSSSNMKESTRPASRSTSFFKKFPWYKVALVDKQSVVSDLSKGGSGNDRISRSNRNVHHNPTSNQTELSQGVSNSHSLVEYGHEEDENAPRRKTPRDQGPTDQQAAGALTSYYKAFSQPSPQLMTSPQEMDERQVLGQIRKAPERPQASQATNPNITEERLLRNPHQVVKDVFGYAQSLTRAGPSDTQPRFPSQSGSMDASFESPFLGDVFRSPQSQWSEAKEHSRMRSYTSSYANSTRLRRDDRPEQGSYSSGTTRQEQESTASPNSSHALRSKVVNLSRKSLGTLADSLPASVQRSDQHGHVREEVKGRGKGIKKIQVTVTFDGAEDLEIEATLKKKERQEHWRTMA